MKTLLSFFLLVSTSALASGNYQQKQNYSRPSTTRPSSSAPPASSLGTSSKKNTSTSAPRTSESSVGSATFEPQPRDVKTIEADILRWDRQGVSIHSVQGNDATFTVKGAYTVKSSFEKFVQKLKGEDSGVLREVSVKESTTSFGGSTSYEFAAEVQNAW